MQVQVAVIGCGHWGKNLVRNFYELGALARVCDADSGTLYAVAERYPQIAVTTNYTETLEDPSIHAVAIATPAATHYELARQAILAGKDVFVEKPLALNLDEGRELVALAEKHQRILMVGHLLRYHPAVNKLKELIDQGALGKIYYIYSHRLNLGRIRTEENILWSFAPHDISVMLYLLDETPSRVEVHGGSYLNPNIPDVTVTNLSFANGVKGHIFVSWLHPYKEHRLVVVGSEGMAVFTDTAPDHKLTLLRQPIAWRGRVPTTNTTQAEPVSFEDTEPLRRECLHFLECVASRCSPLTDGYEGLRVLEVLTACQNALDGRAPAPSRPYFAHETAIIDQPCEIGEGTKIWHFSHIMPHARIGRNCNIGQNVFIASRVVVGDNVKIQNNVSLYEGVILEDDVFCGPSMVFTNVMNPRSHVSRKSEYRQTLVRRGATLGANCTIVCGVTIGRYAFIGAGAVVTRDVPDYALVTGVPARLAGWMCQCGVKLPFSTNPATTEDAECPACGTRYVKHGLQVKEVVPNE